MLQARATSGVVAPDHTKRPACRSTAGLGPVATDPEGNLFVLASGLTGSVYSFNAVTGSSTEVGMATVVTGYRGNSGEATWHRGDLYALNCATGAAGACELVVSDSSWAFTTTGIELPVASAALASRNR